MVQKFTSVIMGTYLG